MLWWSLAFFVIAIIAAVLGFGALAAVAGAIAQTVFYVALVLFVFTLILYLFRGSPQPAS